MSTITKCAIKTLKEFDPKFYRQWASQVKDAFTEREWNDYLVVPAPALSPPSEMDALDLGEQPEFVPDPHTTALAKAFLTQSIPYRYRPNIKSCTTAAQIWSVFIELYGMRSQEIELNYEQDMLNLTKLSTESIDDFIDKFENKLSEVRAQQDPSALGTTQRSTCTFSAASNNPASPTSHGTTLQPISEAAMPPYRTMLCKQNVASITRHSFFPVSDLQRLHRNIRPPPLQVLLTYHQLPQAPISPELPHLNKPTTRLDADVDMVTLIEEDLPEEDVEAMMATVEGVATSRLYPEISQEIPTLFVFTAIDRDTLPITVTANTENPKQQQLSWTGAHRSHRQLRLHNTLAHRAATASATLHKRLH